MRNKNYLLDVAAVCHKGKIRTNNEDNLYINNKILNEEHYEEWFYYEQKLSDTEKPLLFAVFDGMGGHAKGERASFVAAKTIQQCFKKFGDSSLSGVAWMKNCCHEANKAVCKERKRASELLGTTLSMLLFQGDQIISCNVGDSPIFLYREGILIPIYKEHSEKEMYEKIYGKKILTKKKFPLTQHLGILQEEMEISPYCVAEYVKKGDVYIICSDGLSDMVSESEIIHVIKGYNAAKDLVNALRDMALNSGGRDNITLICIKVIDNNCNEMVDEKSSKIRRLINRIVG